MLLQILVHTPKWVYAVFFTLLWFGSKQLLASRVSLGRVALLPVAMSFFSFYGVISAFGESTSALLGWALAALVLAAFVLQSPLPATTRYDAATRSFQVAGSAVPLALLMGIFFTKFVVGVLLAFHPQLPHTPLFAIGMSTIYGAFTGTFVARALRLWKLAMRTDTQRFSAIVAE